jgi:hypothetical protein
MNMPKAVETSAASKPKLFRQRRNHGNRQNGLRFDGPACFPPLVRTPAHEHTAAQRVCLGISSTEES